MMGIRSATAKRPTCGRSSPPWGCSPSVRRWAVGLGSALQLAVLATGLLEWVMVIVALVFIGLWVWVLTMRHDWVRTPGGLRMLVS